MRDPTHQLSVHVLRVYVYHVLLISELHPLCTVCTTIAPRVLHFSAVHYVIAIFVTDLAKLASGSFIVNKVSNADIGVYSFFI